MSSRSSSTQRTQRREHADDSALPPNPLSMNAGSAGTRQQLAMVSEIMAQMLRTTANLQMAQQDFAQRSAHLYDEAAESLRHAQDYNEIVRIQANLMTSCARAAMECCQDLMLAGAKLGSDRFQPPEAPEPEPHSPSSAAEAAMNAMAPAMQAWQQFLSMAAHSGQNPHH
jgi:predicted secreted protein